MFNNEKYYLEATKEFESGSLDEALWAKAQSTTGGDKEKAKFEYIKLRTKNFQKNNVIRISKKVLTYLVVIVSVLVFSRFIYLGIENAREEKEEQQRFEQMKLYAEEELAKKKREEAKKKREEEAKRVEEQLAIEAKNRLREETVVALKCDPVGYEDGFHLLISEVDERSIHWQKSDNKPFPQVISLLDTVSLARSFSGDPSPSSPSRTIYMQTSSTHESLFKSLDAQIYRIYLDRKELDFTANGRVFSHISKNAFSGKDEKIYKDVKFKGSCKKVNYQDLMLMVEKEQEEFNSDFVL